MVRGASGTPSRTFLRRAGFVAFLLLFPQCGSAAADVLVPGAIVALASGMFFLPAILAIETVVARRVLGVSVARGLGVTTAANAASTVAGIPLIAPLGAVSLRSNLVNGAWLLILLSAPLCLVSIWIEKRVAIRLLRSSHTPEQCGRWARQANLASYAIMVGVSVSLLIADSVFRKRGMYP